MMIERRDNEVRQEEHHDQEHRAEERRIDDAHWKQHFGHDHHFAIHHVNVRGGRPSAVRLRRIHARDHAAVASGMVVQR